MTTQYQLRNRAYALVKQTGMTFTDAFEQARQEAREGKLTAIGGLK